MFGGGGGWWVFLNSSRDASLKNINWKLVRRVLAYAKPYRWRIAVMFVLILITTALGLVTPLILRDLIDVTLPREDFGRLVWLTAALIAVPLLGGVVGLFQRRLNAEIGEGVIYDLRSSLYAHLQRMSMRFFTNTKTGELMSRLNNDVVGAQSAISNTIVDTATNLIQIIALLGVMLAIEWRLTIMAVLVLPIFIFIAMKLGDRLREIERERMGYNAQMNAMMNETLNVGGSMLVKLFGQVSGESERFRDRADRVQASGVRRAVVGRQFVLVIGLVAAIGVALTFGLGGYLVLIDVLTVGAIVALNVYLIQLYGALQALATSPVEFATSMVSFERVFEVIDLPYEVPEPENPVRLEEVCGAITFEDVSFRYKSDMDGLLKEVERPGRMDDVEAVFSGRQSKRPKQPNGDKPAEADDLPLSQAREEALKDVSFHIEAGQLVALVGPSGAGKTTMTYLIPRLYDPSEGRILLDGNDLRTLRSSDLARHIGMVTQETHLFHDTIATNLLYARPDATQAQIEAACRAANIHHFINELPEGYDTIVGERGYRLSGGEKQRLALARVILKDPRILVLDEATSHLDSESEALIQDALKTVMAGRTSIVIAHRLSTILAADLILVMDRGQIVEQGRHSDLLAQAGLYARLYHTQFDHQTEEPAGAR